MIANVPGLGARRASTRSPTTSRSGFGANVNRGVARTEAELVVSANPDAVPGGPTPSPRCARSWRRIRAAGSRGRAWCSRTDAGSRRAGGSRPCLGTVVRRTPLRLVIRQRHHYHLDEAPPEEPVPADWMLGGFLMLRRSMLEELGGFDEGFRLYGEDIDLQYRAMRPAGSAGTCRRRSSARAQGRDRHAAG